MILTHDELRLARINHSHTGRAASAEILTLLDHIDAQTERIAALEDALRAIYEYQKIGPAFYRIPGVDGWHITPFTHTQIERVRHECCKVARAALAGGEEG